MHFVSGHGIVADSPMDAETDSHLFAMYRPVSFFDGETERVGQIVKFGKSQNSYAVSARDRTGKYREFYLKWSVLFQRFESVKTY